MSKIRCVNTKFWDDEYIISLNPTEKLLFLYFLTNTLTNIAGCYEISKRRMKFDTGIGYDSLSKTINKFQKDEKIYYIDAWIFIQNFIQNQAMNSKVKIGIQRILREIDGKVKGINIDYDSLCIAYDNSNLNLNLNSNLKISKPKVLQKVENPLLDIKENDIINIFVEYSHNKRLFANITQRKAIKDLVKEFGEDGTLKFAKFAVSCNGKPYAPQITTPLQLQSKMGQLRAYYEQLKSKSESKQIKIIKV